MAEVIFDVIVDGGVEVVVPEPVFDVVTVDAPGPPGEPGPPGPTGAPGPSGGTKWHFGHGPPGVVVGASPGDVYRDLDSGIEYRLD